MNQEITKQVIDIVADQLEINQDKITPQSSFNDDLKADSLAVVELVLALEEAFDMEIPDEDTDQIKTVGDAVKYIEDHRE